MASTRTQSWSYGIGSLFGATAGIAAGLAIATGEKGEIERGLLFAGSTWIALSLIAHAFHLARDFRRIETNSSRIRWGRRLEIFWRFGTAGLLFATMTIAVLRQRDLLPQPKWSVLGFPRTILEDGVQMMCLAFAVGGGSWVAATKQAKGARRVALFFWNLVVGICIAALLMLLLCDTGSMYAMVRVAIHGVEVSMSRWHLPLAEKQLRMDWDVTFSWLSLAAAIGGVINLALLRSLLTRFLLGRPWGWLFATSFCLLSATMAFPVWARWFGFGLLSPALGESPSDAPPTIWLATGLMLALAAFALVYSVLRQREYERRLHRDGSAVAGSPNPPTARLRFYESRWGGVLLASGLTIVIAHPLVGASSIRLFRDAPEFLLMYLVSGPDIQFRLAALAATAAAVFRSHAPARRVVLQGPLEVAPVRYFLAWLFAALILFATLACLALFAFGMWLSPMMRW